MPIPSQNTPELDLRQIILDISATDGWELSPSQVIVGRFQDDFFGHPYQIVIRSVDSDVNPKWQFDDFTFAILVLGAFEGSAAEVADVSWAIHNALVGRDTVYLDSGNRSYQQFNSVIVPSNGGDTPEGRPFYIQRIRINRQILVDEGNRESI